MILAEGLDCDDEKGWQRLANPLSGVLRNLILVLLYAVLLLWTQLDIWFLLLLVPICSFVIYVALRRVPPTESDSWHARAIFGERILACSGFAGVSKVIRRRMRLVKIAEALFLLGIVISFFMGSGGALTAGFVGFMACRLFALRLTEQVCSQAMRRSK